MYIVYIKFINSIQVNISIYQFHTYTYYIYLSKQIIHSLPSLPPFSSPSPPRTHPSNPHTYPHLTSQSSILPFHPPRSPPDPASHPDHHIPSLILPSMYFRSFADHTCTHTHIYPAHNYSRIPIVSPPRTVSYSTPVLAERICSRSELALK